MIQLKLGALCAREPPALYQIKRSVYHSLSRQQDEQAHHCLPGFPCDERDGERRGLRR